MSEQGQGTSEGDSGGLTPTSASANETGGAEGGATHARRRGDDWVTMAVLGKPRGIRGELFGLPYTNHWERFRKGRRFRVWFPKEMRRDARDVVLEEAWSHNARLILRFEDVESIEDAEELRGGELCIHESEREPLPEGEFYYDDLKGLRVVEISNGETVGVVTGFTEGIGPGVVDVESRAGQCVGSADPERWQIPFARDICVDVDLERRELRVKLPAGLRDLNRQ